MEMWQNWCSRLWIFPVDWFSRFCITDKTATIWKTITTLIPLIFCPLSISILGLVLTGLYSSYALRTLYDNLFFPVRKQMFCARLDMAVNGPLNTVSEVNIVQQLLGPENPYGNAFGAVETVLESEKKAIRICDASKARAWRIANATGKINPINKRTTDYKLMPSHFTRGTAQPTLMVDPTCNVAKKGAFAQANLWITCRRQDQHYPARDYTPQGNCSNGLPDWFSKDQELVGQEVTLWHAIGVCLLPHIEDFPVMSCEVTGLTLRPDNFFSLSPTIDIAPSVNGVSQLASDCCNGSKN